MYASDLLNAVTPSDFEELSQGWEEKLLRVLSCGLVDLNEGTNTRGLIEGIFAGTGSLANILALI